MPMAVPGAPASASPAEATVELRYGLAGFSDDWVIVEEPVPEGALHDACLELLKAVLRAWVARTGRDAAAYRNLAVRLREDRPAVGLDPDLCLVEPAPPDSERLESLRSWERGHTIPSLVVEVVSRNHPYKDYALTPDKCAAAGIAELVVFDPCLAGPPARGGPHRLQVWQRVPDGSFARTHAGDGPAPSAVLGAWWVLAQHQQRLRVADDETGRSLWLTGEEAEQTARQAERAAKEAALQRVAELEAELRRR